VTSAPATAGAERQTSSRKTISVAGVATRTLRVPRGDLLEQLVDHELVLPERGKRLPAGVKVTALGERDELLQLGLDGLRLRLGRSDPLVLDDLLAEVREQRLPVGGAA
jgi:hypothetical protein